MPNTKIAVIEDEKMIASSIAARLRSEGFDVEIAHDGRDGVALCQRTHPDLVVLDLMLPGIDGLEVCRQVQRDRPVPVLMLTARDTETDMLVGLGVGADDYMTKPFSMRELTARIRVLLRRVERRPASSSGAVGHAYSSGHALVLGDVRVDPERRRVTVGDQQVHLTATEFDLLQCLAERPGVVLSREQLLAEVWGWRDGSSTRTVDSHIAALRRKVGVERIRTVHGVGYAAEATP
jgi:DNA-binding response OmpR family regulator